MRKKIKLGIIACNTASSLALDYVKKVFSIPMVGVINAGVEKVLAVSKNKRIGVIGTTSTINSGIYDKEILKRDREVKVFSKACPLFVPLVEEGILSGRIVTEAMQIYLEKLKQKKIDALVLGCTHYPLLKPQLRRYFGDIAIVDSAGEVSVYTQKILKEYNLLNNSKRKGKVDFYVTDEPAGFVKLARLFLKRGIPNPKVVNV